MSDLASKRGEIATNRLLDLLRAQDAEKELRTRSHPDKSPDPHDKDAKSDAKKKGGVAPETEPAKSGNKQDPPGDKNTSGIKPTEQPVKKSKKAELTKTTASGDHKKTSDALQKPGEKPENTPEKTGLLDKLKLIRQKSEKSENRSSKQKKLPKEVPVTKMAEKSNSPLQKTTTPGKPTKLDELIAAKKKSLQKAAGPAREHAPTTGITATRGLSPDPGKMPSQKTGASELARIEEILNNIDQRPSVRIVDKTTSRPAEKNEKSRKGVKVDPSKAPGSSIDKTKPAAVATEKPRPASDNEKKIEVDKNAGDQELAGNKAEAPDAPTVSPAPDTTETTEKLEELLKDKLEPKPEKSISDDTPAKPKAAVSVSRHKTPQLSKTTNPKKSSQASSAKETPEEDLSKPTGPTPPVSIATSSGRMRLSRIEKGKTEASDTNRKGRTSILTPDENSVAEPPISPGKPDALLRNTSLKKGEIAPIVVKPTAFDEELFNAIPELEVKPKGGYFLTSLKNKFNEATFKISLHQDNNQLWLLQTREDRRGVEIQKFKEYTLPYRKGKLTLDSMDALVEHVLKNEIDDSIRSISYSAYLSARHPTKTHIFQTPRLKSGDLNDLVAWHAKKNLPFSSDHAVINWEQIKSSEKNLKDDIVIGAGDRSVIEKSISIFEKYNLKLRYYSTIPVIMWKAFIQNYPDLNQGCYVLVRIGEMRTVVTVIDSHKLAFSREIAIGADDLYKAVMKKVTADDKSIQIDLPLARQLLKKYGFPKDRTGISENAHVDLYKISIFLRPVVERITSELNRSLNYFKKQNPDLKWEAMLFDGVASTFPNLLQTISESLNLKVGYFNPLRSGKYRFKKGGVISESQLPNFVINFALLTKNTEPLNIIPEKKRIEYGYIFRSKLMTAMAAALLPLFAVSGFWMSTRYDAISVKLDEKQIHAEQLLDRKNEMLILQKDTKLIEDYYHLLENDRTFTEYETNLLKLLSNIIPDDIKLTSLSFTKETNETVDDNGIKTVNSVDDVLLLNGFVTSDVSLAHIQLTNFRLKLEQLPYFSSVSIDMEDIAEKVSNKFLFNMKLGI